MEGVLIVVVVVLVEAVRVARVVIVDVWEAGDAIRLHADETILAGYCVSAAGVDTARFFFPELVEPALREDRKDANATE